MVDPRVSIARAIQEKADAIAVLACAARDEAASRALRLAELAYRDAALIVCGTPDVGWIPVAERVPEDDEEVLCVLSRSHCGEGGSGPPMVVAWRNGASHGSYEGTWYTLHSDAPLPRDYVSHWRPLPDFTESPDA